MMRSIQKVLFTATIVGTLAFATACSRDDAKKAGESAKEAATAAKEAAGEAVDEAADAAKAAGKAAADEADKLAAAAKVKADETAAAASDAADAAGEMVDDAKAGAEGMAADAKSALGGAMGSPAARCKELAAQQKWAEALAACQAAHKADPSDMAIEHAMQQAEAAAKDAAL